MRDIKPNIPGKWYVASPGNPISLKMKVDGLVKMFSKSLKLKLIINRVINTGRTSKSPALCLSWVMSIYFIIFLLILIIPIKPEPKSQNAAGIGTGLKVAYNVSDVYGICVS